MERREDELATGEQALEAIEGLSPADHVKLILIARFFWKTRGGSSWEDFGAPEDLLQEAILRTLDGDRRWRRSSVSIVKHLDRVMQSISSHEAKRRADRPRQCSLDESGESLRRFGPDEEQRAIARDEVEAVRKFLREDSEALGVLDCKLQGMTASEIRENLGIGEKPYETIWKRIRRKIVRFCQLTGRPHERR